MRIEILAFERESDTLFRASMRVGEITTTAQIVEVSCDDDVVGFNFAKDSLLTLVLFYCGLDKRFNEDFGRFRSGDALSFPLDYGHAEQDGLDKAIAASERLAAPKNG